MNYYSEIKVNGLYNQPREHTIYEETIITQVAIFLPTPDGLTTLVYQLKNPLHIKSHALDIQLLGQLTSHKKEKKEFFLSNNKQVIYRYLIMLPVKATDQEIKASIESLTKTLNKKIHYEFPKTTSNIHRKQTLGQQSDAYSSILPLAIENNHFPLSKRFCYFYL